MIIGLEQARAELSGEVAGDKLSRRRGAAVRHTLPAERDAFVGREQELGELERRLEEGVRRISAYLERRTSPRTGG